MGLIQGAGSRPALSHKRKNSASKQWAGERHRQPQRGNAVLGDGDGWEHQGRGKHHAGVTKRTGFLRSDTARPSGAVSGSTRRKGATTVHDTAPTERLTNDNADARLNGASLECSLVQHRAVGGRLDARVRARAQSRRFTADTQPYPHALKHANV